jgi:hypothetical protein
MQRAFAFETGRVAGHCRNKSHVKKLLKISRITFGLKTIPSAGSSPVSTAGKRPV